MNDDAIPARAAREAPHRRCIRLVGPLLSAVLLSGCALPPTSLSLQQVLEKEVGQQREEIAGYRCTVGAHRGDSVNHLENTLAALRAANENPHYAFIEFDVQYSKDAKIVVFHDKRLLRLFGSLRTVGGETFARLVELSGGEIAAYDSAMAALPDKQLNIEIKSQGDAQEDARLADEIIADLRARGRSRDVLLSSISAEVVHYISRQYPEVKTGQIFWLTSSTYLHFDRLTDKLYRAMEETQADYLILHVANLRNIARLLALKPRDKTIMFWDFDDAIYIVHKTFADRLWGRSWVGNVYEALRFKAARRRR